MIFMRKPIHTHTIRDYIKRERIMQRCARKWRGRKSITSSCWNKRESESAWHRNDEKGGRNDQS